MTRMTVSVPGQAGSAQTISLTAKVVSGPAASASRAWALTRSMASRPGLGRPKAPRKREPRTATAASGRERQDAGPAVLATEGEAPPGLVPGQGRDAAVRHGRAHQQLGGVRHADEEDAAVLVADRQDGAVGMEGDAADLGGTHAAFPRRLAHGALLRLEGPHDGGLRP